MSLLIDLNKRIEKKQDERWELQQALDRLQAQALAVDAVIAELESFAKVVAKEEGGESQPEINLRPGSDVYRSREILRKIGKASEMGDILAAMGKPDTKDNRRSLSAQMAWYARKNQIFTRPEPGYWGLYEWLQNAIDVGVEIETTEPTALPLNDDDIQEPAH
jgi:hypothetical protein